jgi:nitroreductase
MTVAATVSEAVLTRHSCRAYTSRPVDSATILKLIDTARYAPSGGNLQPWIVHVLSGDSLAGFRAMMAPKVEVAPLGGTSEYLVYPKELKEPYRTRRFKVGQDIYRLIGVSYEDRAARIRQFAQNYDFFGAPIGMFFFLDRSMGPPQWSDLGMFIQTLMLLARERGLETCPQEAWSAWHKEVTEFLGVSPELMLFCGLAVGYADYSAPINLLRADRVALDEFAQFHD